MALSISSPFNAEKKQRLAHLSGQLYAQIEKCYTATNHLIDLIHTNLPGRKFQKICIQESNSVKENCELLTCRLNEIQPYLESQKIDMEKHMGEELFRKLMSDDLGLDEKISLLESFGFSLLGRGLQAIILAILQALAENISFMVNLIVAIAVCAISLIGIGILLLGVGVIVAAVLAHVEGKRLDEEIEKYEKAIENFKPASDEFYDKISMIRATIKVLAKKKPKN